VQTIHKYLGYQYQYNTTTSLYIIARWHHVMRQIICLCDTYEQIYPDEVVVIETVNQTQL